MKTSSYIKTQEGSGYLFQVTPASAPSFGFLIFIGLMLCMLGCGMGTSNVKSGGIYILLVLGGLGALLIRYAVRDHRPAPHRSPSQFRVTAEAIEASGQVFRKTDIHRLILKNGVNDLVLVNEAPAGIAHGQGLAHREKLARVSYALNVELGGKSHQLAGGMDHTTAYGLLTDVCRILNFSLT